MWQRFTENARRTVFYAQEEAQRHGEGNVGTEHILLGLLHDETTATQILRKLGADVNRIRSDVRGQLTDSNKRPSADMTLTSRAKRAIDVAYQEARNLRNNFIGTEHLLLAMLAEENGLASQVLAASGVELEPARAVAKALQGENPRGEEPTPAPSAAAASTKTSRSIVHSTALLTIRQGIGLADLLALILLSDRSPELAQKCSQLGFSIDRIMTAIELEMLSGPLKPAAEEARPAELIAASSPNVCALFLAVATTPSSFTSRAFDTLGIEPDRLREVFGTA